MQAARAEDSLLLERVDSSLSRCVPEAHGTPVEPGHLGTERGREFADRDAMRQPTISLAISLGMAAAAWAGPFDQNPQPAPQSQPQGQFQAQPQGQPQVFNGGPGRPGVQRPGQPRNPGGEMDRDRPANRPGRPALPPGTWWRNPDVVQRLAINSDQQKKMEDIFQQHRLKLVDLDASVRREEITLEPLVASESPDEVKTLAQIDKVAQARAELEKANARFLFGIRRVLTPDQWKKLQEIGREERPRPIRPNAPGGPGPRPGRKGF